MRWLLGVGLGLFAGACLVPVEEVPLASATSASTGGDAGSGTSSSTGGDAGAGCGVCCGPTRACAPSGACVSVNAGSSIVYGSERSDATCSDGMDNDLDGFTDCIDWNCCKAGVPAQGVTVCAPGSCAPTKVPTCRSDEECPPDRVCETSGGQHVCIKGCHDASRCLPTWQCVLPTCTACPCAGQCAPPRGLVVVINDAVHHLGDGPLSEGTTYQASFSFAASYTIATLEVDFPGGPGPSLDRPPQITVNGVPAPSLVPFYPPLEPWQPWWQTNADGSHGCNRRMHASLDVTTLVRPGENTFQISNGRPEDDYLVGTVLLWIR